MVIYDQRLDVTLVDMVNNERSARGILVIIDKYQHDERNIIELL